MREILWISLPEQESVDIKGVINYINKILYFNNIKLNSIY